MKTFLNRTLLFSLVLVVCIIIASTLHSHFQDKYLQNINLSVGRKVTTLIIGDSHSETSFDDKIIPNSINIAFHAEHYLFTYFKLKKIIDANPQINKVILSFAPHNIAKNADATIFSLGRNSRSFARYFILLDKEGVEDAYSPSQNWRINYLKWKFGIPFQLKLEGKLLYKSLLNKPIKLHDFPFVGEFYKSSKHVFSDVNTAINGHFYEDNKLTDKSILSIKYLNRIVKYCDSKNIDLLLVNTPEHKKYRELVPKYFNSLYYSTVERIKKYYPNTIIIDYSNLKLNDNDFGDYHHVNIKGAEKVSKEIIKSL